MRKLWKHRYTLGLALYAVSIWFISSFRAPDFGNVFDSYDKLLHFLIYGLFALISLSALHEWTLFSRSKRRQFYLSIIALGLTLLYGSLDEIHQAFVPYRNASLADLSADFLGALFFLVIVAIVHSIQKKLSKDVGIGLD